MTSHSGIFELYHRGRPPKIEVWCTQTFRREAGALFRASSPQDRAHFSNVNELINRLARGERLSGFSFPKEDVGYAFKSGALRFYGVFSTRHPGKFVLSHAIIKRHPKLLPADMQRMKDCLSAFDALLALPATHA